MSCNSESKGVSNIPKGGCKTESATRYWMQIEAVTDVFNCADALDEIKMKLCPTKDQYDTLDSTKADERRLMTLF